MKQTLIDAGFTLHEAIMIEWQYRYAGGFQKQLIELIAMADDKNRIKLAGGFPADVAAFIAFSEVQGWWTDVEERYLEYLKANNT